MKKLAFSIPAILAALVLSGCALGTGHSYTRLVRVVDESGAPIQGAHLHLRPMSVGPHISDRGGRLRVHRRAAFIIVKEGYLQEWHRVEKGQRRIVLKPGDNDLVSEHREERLRRNKGMFPQHSGD